MLLSHRRARSKTHTGREGLECLVLAIEEVGLPRGLQLPKVCLRVLVREGDAVRHIAQLDAPPLQQLGSPLVRRNVKRLCSTSERSREEGQGEYACTCA